MISGPERSTIAIPASSAGRRDKGKIGLSAGGIGCSCRCGKSVESRNDEIKDLWRFDPMVGIDRFRIAADQQEPEQVNWGRPCLDAPLGEVVEQTLALERFFPRGKRWRAVAAIGDAPLPYRA